MLLSWGRSPLLRYGYKRCLGFTRQNVRGNKSWISILYDSSNDEVDQLRQGLADGLLSRKNKERRDLMPYFIAEDFMAHYETLKTIDEKSDFFQRLAVKLGVDNDDVSKRVDKLQQAMANNERQVIRFQQQLQASLTPSYKHLFDDVCKVQNGLAFLVNLRKEFKEIYKTKEKTKTFALQAFDVALLEHLGLWFSGGFLDMQRVTWEKTPAEILEKGIKSDNLHHTKTMEEFRPRTFSGRRIFTFTHPLLPGEPLMFLYVLLCDYIPGNILNVFNTPPTVEDKEKITTAVFHSIISTQKGLDGIGLGTMLIKRAVDELRKEFYKMNTFVTLSPIPGFKTWLDSQIELAEETDDDILGEDKNVLTEMRRSGYWFDDAGLVGKYRQPIMKWCAKYLYEEKRRGFALNYVAHFHLQNGASLWRLNYMGHDNQLGFDNSYGMLVNYLYTLEDIKKNNSDYVTHQTVNASDSVMKLL